MNQSKQVHAAKHLVPYLNRCGSRPECDLTVGGDTYKPLYRVLTLFWAPTLPYLEEVLGNKVPSKEDAISIMKMADPFFHYVFETDMEQFDFLWESIKDVWEDWDEE